AKIFNVWKLKNRRGMTDIEKAKLLEKIGDYRLENDNADDVEPALKNFRYLVRGEAIFDLLQEFSPKMRTHDFTNKVKTELQFIWSAFDQMRLHWAHGYLSKKQLEGWLLAFLYAPLLSALQCIEGTHLQMTEKKPKHGADKENDVRHDAILYYEVMHLDLLTMEAKRHAQPAAQKKDVEKLEKSLASNLLMAERKTNKECKSLLRTYGILVSGFEITIFEARYNDEKCIL
ncbi:hypothetical protein BGZ65_012584, partial [Modicella reniformis]